MLTSKHLAAYIGGEQLFTDHYTLISIIAHILESQPPPENLLYRTVFVTPDTHASNPSHDIGGNGDCPSEEYRMHLCCEGPLESYHVTSLGVSFISEVFNCETCECSCLLAVSDVMSFARECCRSSSAGLKNYLLQNAIAWGMWTFISMFHELQGSTNMSAASQREILWVHLQAKLQVRHEVAEGLSVGV